MLEIIFVFHFIGNVGISNNHPFEDGVVGISRVKVSLAFSSRRILITLMNPCLCGWNGDSDGYTCRAEWNDVGAKAESVRGGTWLSFFCKII